LSRPAHVRTTLSLLVCLAAQFSPPAASAQQRGAAPAAGAKANVLELLQGTWNVTLTTTKPKPSVVTYTESYEWVLGHQFLRGNSGTKSDGSQDLVMATYDRPSGGYAFWIFSSSSSWIYLPPGFWDEATRTIEWKSSLNPRISYVSRSVFPDDKTRRWTAVVKDWKGTVLLEQTGTAVRRDP
jgi:hypothetical protein